MVDDLPHDSEQCGKMYRANGQRPRSGAKTVPVSALFPVCSSHLPARKIPPIPGGWTPRVSPDRPAFARSYAQQPVPKNRFKRGGPPSVHSQARRPPR